LFIKKHKIFRSSVVGNGAMCQAKKEKRIARHGIIIRLHGGGGKSPELYCGESLEQVSIT